MSSLELIMKQLGNKETLQQLGQSVNAKPDEVKKAAELGISTLMEALNRNTNTQQGAEALAKALEQHQDDDVDDVTGFLKKVDTNDGAKIIEHILGGKSKSVQTKLAKQTGMDSDQIGDLLIRFAPLLLSLLGKKKKEENLDATGVSNITSTLSSILGLGSGGNNLLNLASSFLDDDDSNDSGNSGGIGGILGGLGSLFNIEKKAAFRLLFLLNTYWSAPPAQKSQGSFLFASKASSSVPVIRVSDLVSVEQFSSRW